MLSKKVSLLVAYFRMNVLTKHEVSLEDVANCGIEKKVSMAKLLYILEIYESERRSRTFIHSFYLRGARETHSLFM